MDGKKLKLRIRRKMRRIMPEKNIVEEAIGDLVDNFTDAVQKNKHDTVASRFNRLFGREKPIHHVLGGGRSADVLLWRNKKISASFLMGATAIWVLFEWINLHFLSLVCYGLLLGMIAQFVWCNASGFLNRSQSRVPRLVLPKDFFADVGVTIGTEVNRGFVFLQDLSCRGNLKQFLMAVFGLWITAIIGSCCNFLTVLYIGFVGAHTMPVVYERYEDEVDGFVDSLLMKFHSHYKKIDSGFLSRIPSGKFGMKKHD
ncbi:reticulon-like protein B8 isoform X1 [Brassica napus]|uniref:reticulon-like protein B8 isoform X1 n=2 Tax=Brassica napus TaxID=3708 RepID=UPI00207866F1|nr:reticulon-like protein B8 isoform X1 [Brassica napus]